MAGLEDESLPILDEKQANEEISQHLCRVLDMIGYSERMIQFRRQAYQQLAAVLNEDHDNYTVIISGSKGEGLTQPFESDIDVIELYKHVVCTEENYVQDQPSNSTIFTFRPDYKYPGYSNLKLHNLCPGVLTPILYSLIPSPSGHLILSSDAHAQFITAEARQKAGRAKVLGRSGPASTYSVAHFELDRVFSIPSVSPSVLQQWSRRPRQHDWPPVALRDRIATMRGNFVAKGCQRSPNEKDEWRQCFNEAELLLVHSFGETHTKLYVLLKIMTKDLLRPLDIDTTLTSYVMKNIVFWLAEKYPSDSFQPKYLIKWLIRALRMLIKSLKKVVLPYYMIPERNLLHPGMRAGVNKCLIKRVESLIKEGPRMLYKCQKLEFTTRMTHAELSEFCDKRDELEMLYLSQSNNISTLELQGQSNEQIASDNTALGMFGRLHALAYSNWPPHIQRKLDDCGDVYDRWSYILGRKDEYE